MATEPVRVELELLNELEKIFGKKIENEYGILPTKPQLIEIAINLSLGKEVNITKTKKCLKINTY